MTRPPLLPLDDALAQLLAQAAPLAQGEAVATFDADGRVLLRDAVSPLQVPPLDNSAMDGYALRCADVVAPGALLPVSQRIPAGSVGIGGKQTGIYPMESPGGWQLIGRTPLTLFAPGEPLPYAAGDRIRFVPIDEGEFERIQKREEAKRHGA